MHLLGHLTVRDGLTECLKEKGYYAVTSIREPARRWTSAFLYNRMLKGGHYQIPWTKSFSYVMEHFPDCALFKYYDEMDWHGEG